MFVCMYIVNNFVLFFNGETLIKLLIALDGIFVRYFFSSEKFCVQLILLRVAFMAFFLYNNFQFSYKRVNVFMGVV